MDFSTPQDVIGRPSSCHSWFAKVLWLLTFLVAAAVVVLFVGDQYNWFRSSNNWQAVFLSNGQVYFGHVVSTTPSTVVLNDIYYLQSSGSLQAGGSNDQKDLALVKLGGELHGPTDEMRINRDQVLFTEDLKSDSRVLKAIEQHQLGK